MASTQSQDAITLLREDHRRVEDLFKQFEKASGDDRKQKIALNCIYCLGLVVVGASSARTYHLWGKSRKV